MRAITPAAHKLRVFYTRRGRRMHAVSTMPRGALTPCRSPPPLPTSPPPPSSKKKSKKGKEEGKKEKSKDKKRSRHEVWWV